MAPGAIWDGTDWTCHVRLIGWTDLIADRDQVMVSVLLPREEQPEAPPDAEQVAVVDYLEQNSCVLLAIVLSAMRDRYDAIRGQYVGFLDDPETQMPSNPTLSEFTALHDLRQVYIHPQSIDQPPRIGFLFGATWEVEHGVGVLTEGLRVVDVGGADVSFS